MKRVLHPTAAVLAAFLISVPLYAEGDQGGHAQGQEFSAGDPGDSKKPARIVQVTMTETDGKMLFAPSRIESVRRGSICTIDALFRGRRRSGLQEIHGENERRHEERDGS